MTESNAAVVVAAGKSSRMGGGANKVLRTLLGERILAYSLRAFERHPRIHRIVVAGRPEDRDAIEAIMADCGPKSAGGFADGGAERFHSVGNGLAALAQEARAFDAVLIHDAARPFLEARFIDDCLAALTQSAGAIIGVPCKDTLKQVDARQHITRTPDRSQFWLAQTPQAFRFEAIMRAYRAVQAPPWPTDDAAALEALGEPVQMVMGSYRNLKVTTPEDMALAEALLAPPPGSSAASSDTASDAPSDTP